MEENLKQLLLRDLCARLPYDVKVWVKTHHGQIIESDFLTLCNGGGYYSTLSYEGILNDSIVKPYLRPMYSMTEEEKDEYEKVIRGSFEKQLEFYLRNHLDFRGLIPKGLALEALDGMYNK